MTGAQARNLGDGHKDYFQEEHSAPEVLRLEQGLLLAALQFGYRNGRPAQQMRRLVERLLRIVWILELAEAEAMGDQLGVSVLELELRDLYRQLHRRRVA